MPWPVQEPQRRQERQEQQGPQGSQEPWAIPRVEGFDHRVVPWFLMYAIDLMRNETRDIRKMARHLLENRTSLAVLQFVSMEYSSIEFPATSAKEGWKRDGRVTQ